MSLPVSQKNFSVMLDECTAQNTCYRSSHTRVRTYSVAKKWRGKSRARNWRHQTIEGKFRSDHAKYL